MRKTRHARVRKKFHGTAERPRLNVHRSLKQMYAQVIDDLAGETLTSVSTLEPDLASKLKGKAKVEQAGIIGELIAERAQAKGIKLVIFDRGGYRYHGRVRAFAEAARKGGLEF
jgi:large subunit ribosomal protein L18